MNYYPSGTKQPTGSRLDEIVERHRSAVIREIEAHVQSETVENDPKIDSLQDSTGPVPVMK